MWYKEKFARENDIAVLRSRNIVNEVDYCSHCDEPGCDLGSSEFTCPACGTYTRDLDEVWRGRGDILYKGLVVYARCDNCDTELQFFEKDHDVVVKIREEHNVKQ
jgi:predicted RNA-binding Zn-ribbon protein involved in translation (DUF1610 family)